MQTKIPVRNPEYELPFSDDENEDNARTGAVKEIVIEGYKLVFDQKVAVVPSEVIIINQSQV
jgi:hypothetical protein